MEHIDDKIEIVNRRYFAVEKVDVNKESKILTPDRKSDFSLVRIISRPFVSDDEGGDELDLDVGDEIIVRSHMIEKVKVPDVEFDMVDVSGIICVVYKSEDEIDEKDDWGMLEDMSKHYDCGDKNDWM